jgi:hypothetical protein
MHTPPIVKDAMIQNVWLDPNVGLDISNPIQNSYKVGVLSKSSYLSKIKWSCNVDKLLNMSY